ncbi:MAG: MarR family transcriptional regulator [Deltaproteobacteria bacterium]|nr:MarR family transcriptional regulator [Deltaproteobacteria bacterium]
MMVALRRIVRLFRLADREAEAQYGLSAAQLFVLHVLWQEPAMSLADVAARTMTDQSSVSTVVAKLVDKKLVTKKPATDRRRAELRLTAKGEIIVRTAPRLPQVSALDVIAAMPGKQRAELVRAFESFAAAIGANEMAPRMLFEDEPARPRRSRTDVPA